MSRAPICIIGAGASGLMAALWAAGHGRPVLLLEGTPEGGRKILMSGGGRCNILPSASAPASFVTDSSPNTLRKFLRSWPLEEQRRFFEEELGLTLDLEPESGKLFPKGAGGLQVRDRFREAAVRRGAQFRFGARVQDLHEEGGGWRLSMVGGQTVEAPAVVVATGGASFPATGSDGWGFEAARSLGHRVNPTYPALVPLTADPPAHGHLAGISLEVALESRSCGRKAVAHGGFLFTHRGYSGPAVLDLSHLAARSLAVEGSRAEFFVRWTAMDNAAWERRLREWRGPVESLVARHMPSRLAEALCREAGVEPDLRPYQMRREVRLALLANLARYRLPWTGDEGYAKAEVTGGGVDLGEVDPRTLESRLHRGLFFCGEVLDAFGPIGGHNFQWAWATGRAAGLGAALKP